MSLSVNSDPIASIEALDDFISQAENWLDCSLAKASLRKEDVEQEDLVTCPNDSNHRMPDSAMSKHLQFCALRKQGYTDQEISDDGSSQFFYEKATAVVPVKLDLPALQTVCRNSPAGNEPLPTQLPLTAERFRRDLSATQRLAVYEHVTQIAQNTRQQAAISQEQMNLLTEDLIKSYKKAQKEQPKTMLQVMAMKRDMKRRRQSYKGKSYTAKKSHKQVVAEVINNQVEILREMWTKEQGETSRYTSPVASCSKSDHNEHRDRSRSRSRSPSMKKKKKKKHRSPSRDKSGHKEKKKSKKKSKD